MTQDKILDLVGHWQEFLGLGHWTVGVDFSEPCDGEGADARIFRTHWYDTATMYLASDWPSWDVQKTNELIAHELLHLHFRDLDRAWDSTEEHVSSKVWKALDSRVQHEIEGLVDRLARKFVELANS